MVEISDEITFKKDSNEKIEVNQKFVGLKTRDEGILTVNFRTSMEEMDKIKDFFEGLKSSESICIDIGGTGDIYTYFKGISPLLEQKNSIGTIYYFLSVTLQELKKIEERDEPSSCNVF